MSEQGGYRTPDPPQAAVRLLEVKPLGQGALSTLAAVIAALAVCGLWLTRDWQMGLMTLVPAFLTAALARHGNATVHLEYRPQGGWIELVSRGFLTRTKRRRLAADAIAAVRSVRIADSRLVLPLMFNVVVQSVDGSEEDVFGRPLGLMPDEAERARTALVAAIDAARTEERPRARVEIDDADEAAAAQASDHYRARR